MPSFIPTDIQISILERLPVKTLVRFTAVCKSWYSIIKNPTFIKTHLLLSSSSTNNPQYTLFLRNKIRNVSETENNCIVLSQNSFSVRQIYSFNFISHYPPGYLCTGSFCNGVICLSGFGNMDWGNKLFLFNPSIRKLRALPPSSSEDRIETSSTKEYRYFGFGYDQVTDDYKVVRPCRTCALDEFEVFKFDVELEADVYSLRSDSWKRVEVDVHCYFQGTSVTVNNYTYWFSYVNDEGLAPESIVAFDFREEVFREIVLPIGCGYGHSHLLSYKGSLAILEFEPQGLVEVAPEEEQEDTVTVSLWVMKEYGVFESWSKEFTRVIHRWFDTAFGFTRNGKLIFRNSDYELAAWDPESGQVVDLVGFSECQNNVVEEYTESLVLM